ncbi:HIT family protein [Smaragdicoccus niigatensis]|uniref:HIT family protein n=1 Tax=Smaragdicoccus niigatensis TaxID=359359 RepID=UPI00036D26E0|nr:HIT family protein [Smaragdicoccus niigatensis]
MDGCIFCKIVTGEAPAIVVYEDDLVLAFLDIRPIVAGHTLVIPKTHSATLDHLDPDLAADVFRVGHLLARALRRSELGSDGANLLINDGRAAFQTVHHTHLHVVPRKHRDIVQFGIGFVTRRPRGREQVAAHIREGIQRLNAEDAQ